MRLAAMPVARRKRFALRGIAAVGPGGARLDTLQLRYQHSYRGENDGMCAQHPDPSLEHTTIAKWSQGSANVVGRQRAPAAYVSPDIIRA